MWQSLTTRSLYPFVLEYFARIEPARRSALRVLDLPSGAGVLSAPIAAAGFDLTPADLFPEYMSGKLALDACSSVGSLFHHLSSVELSPRLRAALFGEAGADPPTPAMKATRADMEAPLPFEDGVFDVALCVEGIEHVRDRHKTLEEFRRVLKPGGRLLITTPNLLSLRARAAYALAGQRAFKSYIDEYTSVWGMSPDGSRTYHGHAFLISYFQLRYSLRHCGFTVRKLLHSNWSPSSVALSPLAPFVLMGDVWAQRRARRRFERMKRVGKIDDAAEAPYRQMRRHLLSLAMLYNSTLIVEAEAVERRPLVRASETARGP